MKQLKLNLAVTVKLAELVHGKTSADLVQLIELYSGALQQGLLMVAAFNRLESSGATPAAMVAKEKTSALLVSMHNLIKKLAKAESQIKQLVEKSQEVRVDVSRLALMSLDIFSWNLGSD